MKFEIYQAANGRWYWHLRARNGRLIADGGEGFSSKSNAQRSCEKLNSLFAEAVEIEFV